MENIAPEETVLTAMERKMLTEIIEEAKSTEVIETCEKIIEEVKSGTGKGVPKPLKPKEEVIAITNDPHVEKINTKEIMSRGKGYARNRSKKPQKRKLLR